MNRPHISRSELAAITLLVCGVVAGTVVWAARGRAHAPVGAITFTSSEQAPAAPRAATNEVTVTVHVAGAVRSPGLYELPFGSRVNDALQLAGGAKPGAYLDGVNLAGIVRDGEQIYVPDTPTEAIERPSAKRSTTTQEHGPKSLPTAKININSATKADLMRLPGVGEITAARIIAKRKEIGRFTAPTQLMDVDGIGEKKFEAMKNYVTVN